MKYEVRLNGCTDEDILADVLRVYNELKEEELLQSDYLRHGRYSRKAIRNHFGNFNNALTRLGLKVKRARCYTAEEIISDVLKVKKELGVEVITGLDYFSHGKFGRYAIERHFKSWHSLMDRLGLPKVAVHVKHSEEDLYAKMSELWNQLGRQPTHGEFLTYSGHTPKYLAARFPSWNAFLEKFGNYSASQADASNVPKGKGTTKPLAQREIPVGLRYKVLERDHFRCVLCGRSPATDSRVQLHIDHIKPYSKGGKTEMSNLRTLCSKCNLGKGARDGVFCQR